MGMFFGVCVLHLLNKANRHQSDITDQYAATLKVDYLTNQ